MAQVAETGKKGELILSLMAAMLASLNTTTAHHGSHSNGEGSKEGGRVANQRKSWAADEASLSTAKRRLTDLGDGSNGFTGPAQIIDLIGVPGEIRSRVCAVKEPG